MISVSMVAGVRCLTHSLNTVSRCYPDSRIRARVAVNIRSCALLYSFGNLAEHQYGRATHELETKSTRSSDVFDAIRNSWTEADRKRIGYFGST